MKIGYMPLIATEVAILIADANTLDQIDQIGEIGGYDFPHASISIMA